MCGRIALYEGAESLARLLDAGVDPELLVGWQPHWNLGPTSEILGVAERHGKRILGAYRWGLVPSWAKDPAAVKSTFNARAESIASKPAFEAAFRRWRILVPADLFYEWEAVGPKLKQPYAFKRADGDPIVFAGLRAWWKGEDGAELRSATIITTRAGPDMPIHDRQPVVLERDAWDHWLDPGVTDRDELEPLLVPSVKGTLVHYPVSRAVGSVNNDGPELIEVARPVEDPGRLPLDG